ncbi:MAG: MarR family transcriptional regulator [Planctomycetaceae bacterium]|nr:MarR family transcriptional regulator [Planctomycetaceae bacterium]
MTQDNTLADEAKTVAELLIAFMRYLKAGLSDPVINLPLAQLRVCGALRRGPVPMSTLGRELGASLSAMTQIADRLERAKLVRRVPRGDDRRVRCLELTERGQRMMQLHEEAKVNEMAKVLGRLTPEQRQEVTGTLRMLIEAATAAKGRNNDAPNRGSYEVTPKVLL